MQALANRHGLAMSYAAYKNLVSGSDEKYEWVNGEAYAMSGGSPNHSAIATNVLSLLRTALTGQPCRPYNSDLRVRAEATGLATYPDVTVVCGSIVPSVQDAHAATNPRVLVEVLSPTTEAYDRGVKFQHYQSIATLTDYVLVASDRRHVDHYRRQDDGSWLLTPIAANGTLTMASVGVSIALADVYADLDQPIP